jgi:hypothetical protein
MQVWGEAYTRSLTEIALPALLSPGNIPALAASRRTILKLYTTDTDMARIAGTASFARLKQYVEVEYVPIDEATAPGKGKYAAMTAIHRRLVAEAYDEQAALVWILPDTVWADGSLRVVADAAATGKRAVMQAGIRVLKSSALPAVRRLISARSDGAVPPGDLVRLALDHMHPYYRAWYWDAPQFNRNPANVFWRTGDSGMVIRAFHLHPLMLFPERRVRHFVSTFDDDLPLLACPSAESIYIAADSDEIFHIDLAEDDWCPTFPLLHRRPSASYLAKWAWGAANQHHRRFARSPIHIHATPLTPRARIVAWQSGLIITIASILLAVRSVGARGIDRLFGFRMDWAQEIAAGTRIGTSLRPVAPLWWRHLVASCPRSRRGARRRRRLNRLYTWVLATTGARTLGRNVALRGMGMDLQYRRRRALRFRRVLKRLLTRTWRVMQRRLFWYVLLRCLWIDRNFAVTKVRKRLEIANHRRKKRLRYQSKRRRWALVVMRDWLPTTKGMRTRARPFVSHALYGARSVRRLRQRAAREARRVARVGGVRPGRWIVHRAKKGVHAVLIWRKARATKRAQRRADAAAERV